MKPTKTIEKNIALLDESSLIVLRGGLKIITNRLKILLCYYNTLDKMLLKEIKKREKKKI
jgi:hypothetical protein